MLLDSIKEFLVRFGSIILYIFVAFGSGEFADIML
jgi:hypothetical protein